MNKLLSCLLNKDQRAACVAIPLSRVRDLYNVVIAVNLIHYSRGVLLFISESELERFYST